MATGPGSARRHHDGTCGRGGSVGGRVVDRTAETRARVSAGSMTASISAKVAMFSALACSRAAATISATLGPMGLEGAVRLGARQQLEEIDDPVEREQRVSEMVAAAREHANALNIATFAEIDAVIDPADTRAWLLRGLRAAPPPSFPGRRRFIDPW